MLFLLELFAQFFFFAFAAFFQGSDFDDQVFLDLGEFFRIAVGLLGPRLGVKARLDDSGFIQAIDLSQLFFLFFSVRLDFAAKSFHSKLKRGFHVFSTV